MSARRRNGKSSSQSKVSRRPPEKATSVKSADPPFEYLPRKKVIFVKSVATYSITGALALWALTFILIKDYTSLTLPDGAYALILLCGSWPMLKATLTKTAQFAAQAAYKEGFISQGAPSLIFDRDSALKYLAALLLLTYALWTNWFHALGIKSDIVAMAITIDLWFVAVVWMLSIQVRRLPKSKAPPPHRDIASRSRELLDRAVTWILTGMSASLGGLVIVTTLALLTELPRVSFPWRQFLLLIVLYLCLASLTRAAAITRSSEWTQISTPLLWQVIKRVCMFGAASSGVGGFLGFLIGLAIWVVHGKHGPDALTLIGSPAVLGGAIGSAIGVLALPKAAVQRQRELPAVKWLTHIRTSDIDLQASRWGSSDAKRQRQRRKNPAQ